MKPKAANVLEEYDLEVLRTWKVRGAIVCEANKGLFILKEFSGRGEKLLLQDAFLTFLKQRGFFQAEEILKNKEDSLFSKDGEGTGYIVKTYVDGRECVINKGVDFLSDARAAMRTLARLHLLSSAFKENYSLSEDIKNDFITQEFEKHNRELKKAWRFLKEKGQKSDFEHYLLRHYEPFLAQALETSRYMKEKSAGRENSILCHGDFQYHNVLFQKEETWLMNFEKCTWDNRTRDIYHFSRKMLEKCNWMPEVGKELLNAYEEEYPLSKEDGEQLYYRFCYPEKFWKIVNSYYNRRKSFIPDKTGEKLNILLNQEERKKEFIKMVIGSRFSI